MNLKLIFLVAINIVIFVGLVIYGYGVMGYGQLTPNGEPASAVGESVKDSVESEEAQSVQKKTEPLANVPEIEDQDMISADDGPEHLQGSPWVRTTHGEQIQLKIVQADYSNWGIYAYGNVLYSWSKVNPEFRHLEGGDAATFTPLSSAFDRDIYAKDKNNVYCRGNVLVGADTATFVTIPDWYADSAKYETPTGTLFYQDKNHQYAYGQCYPYKK